MAGSFSQSDIDVDEEMLSSQVALGVVDTEERTWENMQMVDEEKDNEGQFAAEDGPPPELQYEDTDSVRGESPKLGCRPLFVFSVYSFSPGSFRPRIVRLPRFRRTCLVIPLWLLLES